MNLKTALKEKNKLVATIKEEWNKVFEYNSVDVESEVPYDVQESYNKWNDAVNSLVALKAAIHRANIPVFGEIFRLSELKSQIISIKGLDCSSGKIASRGYGNTEPIFKRTTITLVERDSMIKFIESEIEELQNKLDTFNLQTTVRL